MGQFLAIGLVTKIGVKKVEIEKANLNIDQVQEHMRHDLHYVRDIYTASEEDGWYYFRLNEDIFHTKLLPFLKTLYPVLYSKPVYYENVLKTLATLSPSEWLQWAQRKSEEAFQFDEYGMWDYLSINHVTIRVYYDCILLSMEGKIVMETFGRQFTFVKYAMMQTFQQFRLAGALRMYITG